MLETVLADVLTRILGQYLEGIDRESVRFGAWSGLVELRGVALRSEALAVLFETLGLDLPVTVEAGFIGLLRLQVPWKSIGTTPVQVHMEDITIVARPVRGDGSDNSELENRERRIKRAKLSTDDAVREASWGVSTDGDNSTSSYWSSWLVSDQLRAKIVDNIQIHLKDIILRFEDHFSNPQKPYIASVACKALKAVSVNESWAEAFVERRGTGDTRKLLEIIGFRLDWAPITPENCQGPSRATGYGSALSRFKTPELLRRFLMEGSAGSVAATKELLHSVDGSMRLHLSAAKKPVGASQELREQDPAVDLDIRFPEVYIDLDDVQYASILQTSVYFARLSTRGIRPQTAKARWVWAINQLLPGFSTRRARALRLSERGISEARDKRILYVACRKSLLKARRSGLEEPKDMLGKLEAIEDELSYTEILAYRDRVDRIIELEGKEWPRADDKRTAPPSDGAQSGQGTTTSSFWKMLGYSDDSTAMQSETVSPELLGLPRNSETTQNTHHLSLRVGFLLSGATLRLCQGGYPVPAVERIALKLKRLQIGLLYATTGELVVESVVGGIEAWDLTKHVRMVYSRLFSEGSQDSEDTTTCLTSYPHNVSEALDTIRSGSNPARDVLLEEETFSVEDVADVELREEVVGVRCDQQSTDFTFLGSKESFENAPQLPKISDTQPEDSVPAGNTTHRVTEAEFLGNPRNLSGSQKYIAAFRFTKQGRSRDKGDVPGLSQGLLEVSVATLEAVVDGPKGSFLWGLKFWKPKGMVRDPIMAFLGAAAGARIAELRIELEEALLANRVPMQISAVIMAPRFIIPGNKVSDPAFVVNMGTLGVFTSEGIPGLPSPAEPSTKLIRYSNYVLTLDDLGVYFCPELFRAVSCDLSIRDPNSIDPNARYIQLLTRRILDTTDVERIIRPFSLRFVLQSLRDSSVVQVAHSSSEEKGDLANNIAKVRVRGTIPGLSVILTLKAFQQLAAAIHMWSEEFYAGTNDGIQVHRTSQPNVLSSEIHDESGMTPNFLDGRRYLPGKRTSGPEGFVESQNLLTTMASYDVKVLVKKVSLDIRQTCDSRLITTLAEEMVTSIVKTGRKRLSVDFSLGSLSITDGSRGSTAAFRRLLYAGNLSGTKGVSPPRSMVDISDESKVKYGHKENFVNFRYELDLRSKEQQVFLRFLSLNMVCVRETYVRIGVFSSQVHEYVKTQRRQRQTNMDEAQDWHSSRSFINAVADVESSVLAPASSLLHSRLTVTSEFAGFNLQLVASGGAVAVVEMKDSCVYFSRSKSLPTKLWGEFHFFSVQDLTAAVDEHMAVITYNRPNTRAHNLTIPVETGGQSTEPPDEWSLTIPTTSEEPMLFKAAFQGFKILYLARFSDVIRQYMFVLLSELRPVMAGTIDDYEVITNDLKATAAVMPKVRTSVVLRDLLIRLPRHSNCSTEAVNLRLSSVELTDRPGRGGQTEWYMHFLDLQMAVEYMLGNQSDARNNISISSTFLTGVEASLVLRDIEASSVEDEIDSSETSKCASLTLLSPVRVNLCEAQYTVLYFVLTENFAETIYGLDVSTDASSSANDTPMEKRASRTFEQMKQSGYSRDSNEVNVYYAGGASSESEKSASKVLACEVFLPFLSTEISRGWDVAQERCKVIGFYMKDVNVKLRKSEPFRLLIELEGYLLGLSDLRAERAANERIVAIPLLSGNDTSHGSTNTAKKGNVSITYDKEGKGRPSIVVYTTELELELSISLFRDMTYLAIPGWPFLQLSSFAPDIEYLGRTMNVLLSESQIILRANEFDGDSRAVVLTGEFLLKVDWKRKTGAKRVSIRSSQVEICTTSSLQARHRHEACFGVQVLTAEKVKRSETPLAYPTDSFLEYVGPDVDEGGRRIEFSVDAFLCVICATDIPLLRAVLSRISPKEESYLTQRDWVQPAAESVLEDEERGLTPKERRTKRARENINLFATIPAARYLLTDDREGRFVSILEARLNSLSITAHGESMIQVGGEVSLDLFNADNGWWEPAIETWDLTASMSRGQSGTHAFVIRSDRRLNVNITPTTVSTSMAVAKALKSIARKERLPDRQRVLPSLAPKVGANTDVRRPSIAAFLVRNELGIPVNMSLPRSSRTTSIANNAEVEVGAESESLLTSTSTSDGRSREKALHCSISLPTSEPVEVSAAEVGVYPIQFLPRSEETELDADGQRLAAAPAVWDVRMIHGVPVCTVRSPLRIRNDTKTSLEINIVSGSSNVGRKNEFPSERIARLEPGKFASVSLLDLHSEIMVRPFLQRERGEVNAFEWSDPLPSIKRLRKSAYEAARAEKDTRKPPATMDMRRRRYRQTVVCKSHLTDNCDFYLTIAPKTSLFSSSRNLPSANWVDVALEAPVVLENKLPGSLGYRILRGNRFASSQAGKGLEGDGAVLAAGLIKPLQDVHLHISRDSLDSTFISLAYDNRPLLQGSGDHDTKGVLSEFGTSVCLADLRNGGVFGVNISCDAASRNRTPRALTLSLLPNLDGSYLTVFAGYWVRNRSDTTIEICSRSSFYGAGSATHILRQRPPSVEPDSFVCCEGPYISIRLPREGGRRSYEGQNHSGWWTSTTVLDEIDKPINVGLPVQELYPSRTLELEVRPAEGLDCQTHIITIRNSTWIVNHTNSPIQWCQASALDAHGNCPTRLLNSLTPGESQALHWETKSSRRAVHFRLADSIGQSDWIWSPAVPIDIGFSRELPAKMYRPKTHEQYIARVSLKEIAGSCKALVVRQEDRQNPPYRIINLCKERAVAFRQTNSQERHWLLRAGKTTRYSWDDPLAPRKYRLLSVRLVSPGELLSGKPLEASGNSSTQRKPSVHPVSHDLQIDVVGNTTVSSPDFPRHSVTVNISVDGATKVVTFADTDVGQVSRNPSGTRRAEKADKVDKTADSVLIVGWDEIKRKPIQKRTETPFLNGGMCDYPSVSSSLGESRFIISSSYYTDVAIFFESLGISIVDATPCELVYIWYKNILFNYQSHEGEERYSLNISELQADNQLYKTPFPVLLSITSNGEAEKGENSNEPSRLKHAIALQVHRDVTKDDILMVSSFQADIRGANLFLEDKIMSKAIRFLSDSSLVNSFSSGEVLRGEDSDYLTFKTLTPHDTDRKEDEGATPRQKRHSHAVSTSRRIYVREFGISSSSLRLTSAGSGSALAKAAGMPVSVRAVVGLLLNVNNCEFLFAPLKVQNVFDSVHHFLVLVREYYIAQLNDQRMKLLGSNSLMGNPAALFDAVGVFFNESGRAKGPSDFIASVGRGSKSLFAHTVGGIADSVSGIPRALSSGIEAALDDKDYLAERQRIHGLASASGHRGSAAKNPAQGLATGAISFAHGLSSSVHGIIRDPVQGAKQDGARGLLKGIGKGVLGAFGKSVAGTCDLIAEPAAGLSRQISDTEKTRKEHFSAVPDRPPRAFRGRNPRLELYDRRYALGVFMFQKVQALSGVSYSSSLVEWVELSGRNGRTAKDSETWVWDIVQRSVRKVPGTKARSRNNRRSSGQDERPGEGLETRLEKTRVALVTENEVLIATLDCKLIDVVPLWEEANYAIYADGKDLLIRAEMPRTSRSDSKEASVSSQGSQPFISAPWDASNVGKRSKPIPGSESTDRVACGSFEARNDLRTLLGEVTKSLEIGHHIWKNKEDNRSSGVELSSVDEWSNPNETEMRSSDHDAHLATADISRLKWTPAGKKSWGGPKQIERVRTPATLEKTVRRLSMSGARKSDDSRYDLRMILANKLPSELVLRLFSCRLEHGVWKSEAPGGIEALDAQSIDVGGKMEEGTSGMEVSGVVVYNIVEDIVQGSEGRESTGQIGQIVIEFFRGKDEAASFTTRATRGYQAEFVSGGSKHGSAIFTITETLQGQKARLQGKEDSEERNADGRKMGEPGSSSGEQRNAEVQGQGADSGVGSESGVGLSEDELLVQQLVEIGFRFEDAVVALAEAGGDMVKAVDILTK